MCTVNPNGKREICVSICGTIPVTFRGQCLIIVLQLAENREREIERDQEQQNYVSDRCVGRTYNIPIIFWIHPKHPYEAPVVYVLPTANMDIQPSQYVDANGRVHMPYLNFWKVS